MEMVTGTERQVDPRLNIRILVGCGSGLGPKIPSVVLGLGLMLLLVLALSGLSGVTSSPPARLVSPCTRGRLIAPLVVVVACIDGGSMH